MSQDNKTAEILQWVGSIFETTGITRQEMNEKISLDDLDHPVEEVNELTIEELQIRGVQAAFHKLRMERITRAIDDVSMMFVGPNVKKTMVNQRNDEILCQIPWLMNACRREKSRWSTLHRPQDLTAPVDPLENLSFKRVGSFSNGNSGAESVFQRPGSSDAKRTPEMLDDANAVCSDDSQVIPNSTVSNNN
jgi:hypothetical protein